ncbi:hypothetical protein CGZ76_02270 [Aeromonas veronii]|nr:hypothetical protein CGZ76_02270 [Aeromonas veronii]
MPDWKRSDFSHLLIQPTRLRPGWFLSGAHSDSFNDARPAGAPSKFGEGIVLNFEGVGQQSRGQIQFDDVGAKWLVTAYARLEAL